MPSEYSVSVIVPARDEEGTIASLVKRIPVMGKKTEIIFVEGFSKDDTWKVIRNLIKNNTRSNITMRAVKQGKIKGKQAAVYQGFMKAKGEILIILDADLSVAPEELTKFYEPLMYRKADFVNGSRFIIPQEDKAMRFLNTIGNRVFALVFSILLRQRVTDTLCGTKALFSKDWKRIQQVTHSFAKDDPYGDFQLFLGASLLGLRIIEVPVKYYARVYGTTKISRFTDGLRLLMIIIKLLIQRIFILRPTT